MTSILVLLGVAVIGVCILAIALSDRRRVSTIAEADVESPQPGEAPPSTSRSSGLDLLPDPGRTFGAMPSRTAAWRPAPPARLH